MTIINSLNPTISMIAGKFNGKCSKWYSFDTVDNTRKKLDNITSIAGYIQIIDKANHFTNHSPSRISLISTFNPSKMVESGIKKSLCSNCHHDIT